MADNTDLYTDLRDRLVNGGFKPNQRLRADELRKDYGVSASNIREVLFRLSTVGLVDFLEQKGFRTPERSDATQHDLTQFRIYLECQGACLSIRLGGLEWEARLSAAHHKLSHIENYIEDNAPSVETLRLWTTAELNFHQTLIDACELDSLKQTHDVVYHRFRQQMFMNGTNFYQENVTQHREILEAVLKKDELLTCDLIHMHLSRNLQKPLPRPMAAMP
ncbi:MAG: GntR family transcriptional regulator [Thalassovita sp.]